MFGEYQLHFGQPWYLLLAAFLPIIWLFSYRSLAGLGGIRRIFALLFRSVVLLGLTFALAEAQIVRVNDRLTVIYLLDQSLSIPLESRRAMVEYVNLSILEHRRPEDLTGVIVFGRDAAIEVPPFDDDVQLAPQIEAVLDPEYTNLAGALKLAQASFVEGSAKRIVIVTDGNENVGDARQQAAALAESGVGIDVVPVRYDDRDEILIEKLVLPSDVRKGLPFEMRIVLENTSHPIPPDTGVIGGTLIVTQRTSDQPVVLAEMHIDLPPGKHVYTITRQIDQPDFYTYEAYFRPDDPADDAMLQNNRATAFTHVRGAGRILFIEDHENPGEFSGLIEELRNANLEVTVQPTNQLFTGLPQLQPFDAVVLANVPREHFTNEQMEMLVLNTQDLGAGLLMLGGPNSFGAGGWTNSLLEAAMPVDFEIKNAKVVPKGALALIMHASEMPDGNYWQKVIAKEAIRALGSEDYAGLLHWDGTDRWLWNGGIVRVGDGRSRMLGLIDRMTPGDMPDFDPGLRRAADGFAALTDAANKHMIIISDGDPSPPSRGIIQRLVNLKVTVTTVAVGCHGPAESQVMRDLANDTGGKYYEVTNPQALPRIFQREARRVARSLIYESATAFAPSLVSAHDVTLGLPGQLPPLTGLVLTRVKENPLVELAMTVPKPEPGTPLLATWTYGLGRTAVFTSDAGARWTKQWPAWDGFGKLYVQLLRWVMRPSEGEGSFTIASQVEDGRVRVIVNALDKDDQFLNFLDLRGSVIGPDLKPAPLALEQIAPGRYVGEFPADDSGSYFLSLQPGAGKAPLLAGVNVPYSAEFTDRLANDNLLSTLAALQPAGGEPGQLVEDSTGQGDMQVLLQSDPFRRDLKKATSSQDIWHWLLVAASCLFLGDIFTRRVSLNLAWIPPFVGRVRDRLLGRDAAPAPVEYMDRLRSKKAEISQQLDQRRAATRFEPSPDAPPSSDTEPLTDLAAPPPPSGDQRRTGPGPGGGISAGQKEEESYTSRLLKAKRKVWEERDKP